MAKLKHITVSIKVDRNALPEYKDENEKGQGSTKIAKYVEATSGARFLINFVVSRSFRLTSDATLFEIYLDGKYVEKFAMTRKEFKQEVKEGGEWMSKSKGRRVEDKDGNWSLERFCFVDFQCTEQGIAVAAEKFSQADRQNLGTIVVKAFRAKLLRPQKHRSPTIADGDDFEELVKASEKDLKGRNVTHRAKLGSKEPIKSPDLVETRLIDGEDAPFAVFQFKYCSRKALQSLLIIPRTPSPPRSPTPPREPSPIPLEERAFESLNMEEVQELCKRQQARYRAEREAGIKSEPGIKSERGIKRERDEEVHELLATASAKKVKGPIANGELVDLSD